MGGYFSVEYERGLPGAEIEVLPLVARAACDLDKVARKLRVPSLWHFCEYGPEDEWPATRASPSWRAGFWRMIGGLVERHTKPAPAHVISWYDAVDGVRSVECILQHVRQHRGSLAGSRVDVDEALAELDDLKRGLRAASSAGVRFHLKLYT